MSGESFGRRENLKKDLMERNDIILTVLKLKLCYDAGKQILESELINIRTDTFVFLFTVNGAELLEGKQKFNFFLSASVSLLIISWSDEPARWDSQQDNYRDSKEKYLRTDCTDIENASASGVNWNGQRMFESWAAREGGDGRWQTERPCRAI